jgi:hypothetical protein
VMEEEGTTSSDPTTRHSYSTKLKRSIIRDDRFSSFKEEMGSRSII